MRKLIFLIIICFIGYYGYKHQAEIKIWINKIFGQKKVETVSKKSPTKSDMCKFTITMKKDAVIKSEEINDINIILLSIKDKNKVLIMIDKEPCNLEKKADVVKFLRNNNKLTLRLFKTYKDKAELGASISAIKEKQKDVEIVNIEK